MKRSITGAGHALSLALALLACDRSPEQHLLQAQERLAKHEYPAAVVELKSALQQQPENGDARLLLGQAFVAIAAYPDAVTELLKARELGVANDQVLAALLEAYVKMGQPQKALDLGLASAAAAPAIQAIVLTRRAEAQIALRQKDQAKESIAAARRADPEQPATLLVEAVLALIDQEKERAGQLVAAALQRDAKFADALYFQAGLLQAENKVEEAVQVYRQILADDPAQFRAHLAIADLHQRRGDMAAAEAAISAAEKVSGSAPTVRFARGNLELRRGNLPAANTALLEVLRVAPDHVPTLLAAALVGFGLGDYQQSISRANKVLAVQADNLLAAKILADSQLHSGDDKPKAKPKKK
jgi:tetratricopeptide (TPR) repeat protein